MNYGHRGRDAAIERVFQRIEPTSKFVFEFGALDGVEASNSRRLLTEKGWGALLIEYSAEWAAQCAELYKGNDAVTVIHSAVTPKNVVGFMHQAGVPEDIDLITVDIDSYDLYVWEAVVREFQPKAVMVEYNQSFAPPISVAVPFFEAPTGPIRRGPVDDFYGASLQAYCDLNLDHGYQLVAVIDNDAIFVREEFFHRFGVKDNSPEKMYVLPPKSKYGYSRSRHPLHRRNNRPPGRAPNQQGHIPSPKWEELGLL